MCPIHMSTIQKADTSICASCGIAEVDDIKLMDCTDCGLVQYCGGACQRDHQSYFEEACKKRNELLFKQPECTHLGDCPICMIPLPLDTKKSIMQVCCSNLICYGCDSANDLKIKKGFCPFCHKPTAATEEERDKQMMKRIEANDPLATYRKAGEQYNKGDYSSAFEWYTKAAELGDAEAHHKLSIMYHHDYEGGMVKEDMGMAMYHLEEAAIGGHPNARFNLGCYEWNNGNTEKAVKHWIIAAALGDDDSIKFLMNAFRRGFVEKDDLATALRAHQAAVDATKSPQREAAEDRKVKVDWTEGPLHLQLVALQY